MMNLTTAQRRTLEIAASRPAGNLVGCPDPRTIRVLLNAGFIEHEPEFGHLVITETGRQAIQKREFYRLVKEGVIIATDTRTESEVQEQNKALAEAGLTSRWVRWDNVEKESL